MNNKLVIIGAGGHAKVCLDIAVKMNKWDEIVLLDDSKQDQTVLGFEVVDSVQNFKKFIGTHDFFVAIGDNTIRSNVIKDIESNGGKLVNLVHPKAIIGIDVSLGIATVVMGGVVVNSSTIIGKGCIVNTSSVVDHDCELCDYVHISPGVTLSGEVKIGEKTWIGTGANVIHGIDICKHVMVGAGSLVIQNIIEKGTYAGSPLRRL